MWIDRSPMCDIHGLSLLDDLLTPILYQMLSLFIGQKSTLNAFRATGIGWQVEHVASAQQALSAPHVDDGTRIDGGTNHEGDTRRDVGLDQAGNHIYGRPLGRDHEVDAG